MEGLSRVSALYAMIVTVIVLANLFLDGFAANITVGGPTGWSLSSDLTHWSNSTSFFLNDSLVFSYTPDHDVIELNGPDFAACRISHPIATYDDGETVILLTQPGTRYFVCGRPRHCNMGLKLLVNVLNKPSPPSTTQQPNITAGRHDPADKPYSECDVSYGRGHGGRHSSPSRRHARRHRHRHGHDHGGDHDGGRSGGNSSDDCSGVGFITSGSSLLYLSVFFLAFLNHLL